MGEDDRSIKRSLAAQDPIVRELVQEDIEHGVLIPLKTTLELRDDYQTGHVLITRTPTKAANPAILLLRNLLPDEIIKGLPHLRRCAKPSDLPAHLKAQFMNESPQSRQIHTGKSSWIYIIVGPENLFNRDEVAQALSTIEGMEEEVFLRRIPVPMVPPTSQVQAAMWSQHFWPSLYRKNNPLGPHPSMIARQTEEIANDAAIWMALAHKVARESHASGYGEPMGACIIQRDEGRTTLVALAGDARWCPRGKVGCSGNPMAHSAMRAISIVAQKLVRAENRKTETRPEPILEFEAFQDKPLLDDEKAVYDLEHPNPDGYLCHGLEMYLTHEPCVMCSMAILHSRMGKVVFRHRMPLTGGLCAEDRGRGHPALKGADGGRGLGLFWRRELNWSMVAWEWESSGCLQPLRVDGATHA
ncbi:cytidine deaminase-like protein [Thermothelomyces thermophilus ATCC 42464]|uniref:Cytidine deaminase-like protein n=1 Tax=Thermothelomyces thermophilus (strain ATCC 42464 / BCRC 31852 / DSM 1799) TaxID=573729 RepID=G2QN26_THET4|nr:cytidine deaminase-like protein [Thermothelomyces thermophilus ATCC 42464]AEO61899.1 cytidine deaminase-like protein [Thermothelomyces thermophilus ATCC 42464]